MVSQLISIFLSIKLNNFENDSSPLWYSWWIIEQVNGTSRRAPDAMSTSVCVLNGLSIRAGGSSWSHALVSSFGLNSWQISMPSTGPSRSVLQSTQCNCWKPGLLNVSRKLLVRRGRWVMRKQVEILSSDCLSCTPATQLRQQFPVPIRSCQDCFNLQQHWTYPYEAANTG